MCRNFELKRLSWSYAAFPSFLLSRISFPFSSSMNCPWSRSHQIQLKTFSCHVLSDVVFIGLHLLTSVSFLCSLKVVIANCANYPLLILLFIPTNWKSKTHYFLQERQWYLQCQTLNWKQIESRPGLSLATIVSYNAICRCFATCIHTLYCSVFPCVLLLVQIFK